MLRWKTKITKQNFGGKFAEDVSAKNKCWKVSRDQTCVFHLITLIKNTKQRDILSVDV